MAKRQLTHDEMQELRKLCLRSGMSKRTYNDDECKRLRFLARRGLVSFNGEHPHDSREFTITEEGLIEVAKSGRFTLYEAKYLVETYAKIKKMLDPVFKHAYLFANPMMEWMDPEFPADNIVSLQRLRGERDNWRSSLYGDADWVIWNAMSVIENILHGCEASKIEHDIECMKAMVDKVVRKATET